MRPERVGGLGLSLALSGLAHAYLLGWAGWPSGPVEPGARPALAVHLSRAPAQPAPSRAEQVPALAGSARPERAARAAMDEPVPAPPPRPMPVVPSPRPAPGPPPGASPDPVRIHRPAVARLEPVVAAAVRGSNPTSSEPLPTAPPGTEIAAVNRRPLVAPRVALPPPAESSLATARQVSAASAAEPASIAAAARSELLGLINHRISAHRQYPRIARRQGREGWVRVSFRLYPDGHVEGVDVIRTSRFAPLDEAARRAVTAIAPFTPAARYLSRAESFQVDVRFALR